MIALATEDELSETVGLRLLAECGLLDAGQPLLLRKNGSGYLKSKMKSWHEMARNGMVLLLTDLDRLECPVSLLSDWLGVRRQLPENLLLRVAVREIESWVLADHLGVHILFGKELRLPVAPDELPDPKQHLLMLARKASRRVRENSVVQRGAVASQGVGYNRLLSSWVQSEWSPERAAQRSPSLRRTRDRLREFALRA